MIEPSLALVVAGLFVLAGAIVQGGVGFGLGLVSAPFLMWAIPDAMPGALIVLAAGMTLTTLVNHVRWIEWPALGWGTLGRLPGVALGTWLVVVLSLDALGVIVGAAVLVAVALQRSRWQIQKNRTNLLLAGTLSGAMGTATGIGGPPMAMVMAGEPGPIVRGTLAAYFLVGSLLSAASLAFAGRLGLTHLLHAAVLVPPMVLGALLARPLARFLDDGRTRTAILTVVAASGLMLMVTSLL